MAQRRMPGWLLPVVMFSALFSVRLEAEQHRISGKRISQTAEAVVSWQQMRAATSQRSGDIGPLPPSIPLHTETVHLEEELLTHSRAVNGLAAAAPILGLRFKAADRNDTIDEIFPEGIRPPDTMGAVGPNHFVEVINNNVSIFDKATGYRLSSVPLIDFFVEVHTEDIPFDPRVLFDQHSGRWVAMAADCRCDFNSIVFGITRTDDPTGEWFLVGFEAGGFADYPTLGVDADGIYVAANFAEKVWAIEKAPLLQDPPVVGTITEFNAFIQGALQPAHTYDTPPTQYFVQTAGSTSLEVYELQGPLTKPTLISSGTLSVPFYSSPPDAPALESTVNISVGSGAGNRLQMAVYRDGSLWTCHAIGVAGRGACRWYEIDPQTMTLLQSGTVSDPSLHYYYPSIMVNMAGDATMGFSGSDATQYVATYFTGRLQSDPAGQMSEPVLLKAGESAYTVLDTNGRNRWGDYSYTTLDPVDQLTFWTIQEYASSPENNWGTWVGQISFEGFDCNNNDIPDAADIGIGSSMDCDANGVPDECQRDCNLNDIADTCDLIEGSSDDSDSNGVPDECQCIADLDQRGSVNIDDLLTLLADWGSCPDCPADLNEDGVVGIDDLLLLLAAWGPCSWLG